MAKVSNLRNFKVQVDSINHQVPWQSGTVAHCFRPIYIVSRVFGLMPFSITFQSNGEVQKSNVSKIDISWFVTSLCLLIFGIFLVVRTVIVQPSDPEVFSIINALGDTGILMTGLIVGSLSIVLDLCNRHKWINIVKRITLSDKEAC